MFKQMSQEIDLIANSTDENENTFILLCAHLYQIPVWKLCAFYLYTFTFLRDWQTGRDYRSVLKYVLVAYRIHYQCFKHRLRQRMTFLTGWFANR